MSKRPSKPAAPAVNPNATHRIVTRDVQAERTRGHAAITATPAKRRR